MALSIILFLAAYLTGSVNFSILVLKLSGREDPRHQFSGNPGVTNVYRQEGWLFAALVLIMEIGKSAFLAYMSLKLLPKDLVPFTGFFLVFGNRYTCFHGFNGGKGVAGYLGFTAVLSPAFTLASLFGWVIVYRISRLPFVASFAMVGLLAAGTVIQMGFRPVPVSAVFLTVILILFNHKKNISEYLGIAQK